MSEAVYARDAEGRLVPSGHARGPWDPHAQHAGGPAGLLARAVERCEAPGPMLLARLTIELLGPVPMAPLEVRAEVVRPGRRLQLVEASVVAEGEQVCRARAVRLRRDPVALPPAAARGPSIPGPEAGEPFVVHSPVHDAPEGFGPTAMELRFCAGSFVRPGPAIAWFRLRMPLVEGEEPTPTQRVAAAADFGNGIGAELDFATHLFVNTDLTVHLFREPEGDWTALQARTDHGPDGTATAVSTLHDLRGPVGLAAQSLYVAERAQ
jgi:hypothetical protein